MCVCVSECVRACRFSDTGVEWRGISLVAKLLINTLTGKNLYCLQFSLQRYSPTANLNEQNYQAFFLKKKQLLLQYVIY